MIVFFFFFLWFFFLLFHICGTWQDFSTQFGTDRVHIFQDVCEIFISPPIPLKNPWVSVSRVYRWFGSESVRICANLCGSLFWENFWGEEKYGLAGRRPAGKKILGGNLWSGSHIRSKKCELETSQVTPLTNLYQGDLEKFRSWDDQKKVQFGWVHISVNFGSWKSELVRMGAPGAIDAKNAIKIVKTHPLPPPLGGPNWGPNLFESVRIRFFAAKYGWVKNPDYVSSPAARQY